MGVDIYALPQKLPLCICGSVHAAYRWHMFQLAIFDNTFADTILLKSPSCCFFSGMVSLFVIAKGRLQTCISLSAEKSNKKGL